MASDELFDKNDHSGPTELPRYPVEFRDPDPYFDDIAKLTLNICEVSSVVVTFMDARGNFIKAAAGVEFYMDAQKNFMCNLLIEKTNYIEVEDTLKYEQFKFSPLLLENPIMRFLGKMPIMSRRGTLLGSICLMNQKSRKLNKDQITSLEIISRIITAHLESNKLIH
ncbi:MAG: GAF domain-containing protein [Cyclobacteriaceae bacterium]